jgi:hypothetical protein
MPPITRYFVKASFVALALALIAGVWAQIPGAAIPGLHSVYTHLLTYGWLTQLIFGVALWMFPVFNKQLPRGPIWLGWFCFATLNIGLYLRVGFEPLHIRLDNPFTAWMLVLAAVLQWLAGAAFVALTWTRVRER